MLSINRKRPKGMLETEENFDRMREINKRKKGDRLQTEKKEEVEWQRGRIPSHFFLRVFLPASKTRDL
jgi:hypothetical protein